MERPSIVEDEEDGWSVDVDFIADIKAAGKSSAAGVEDDDEVVPAWIM